MYDKHYESGMDIGFQHDPNNKTTPSPKDIDDYNEKRNNILNDYAGRIKKQAEDDANSFGGLLAKQLGDALLMVILVGGGVFLVMKKI